MIKATFGCICVICKTNWTKIRLYSVNVELYRRYITTERAAWAEEVHHDT